MDSDDEIVVASTTTLHSPPTSRSMTSSSSGPDRDPVVVINDVPTTHTGLTTSMTDLAIKKGPLRPKPYPPASVKAELIKSDFADLGLSAKEIKRVMPKKEDLWDSTMQRPHGLQHAKMEKNAVDRLDEKLEKRRRGSGEAYEPLFLSGGGNSNWVLFDPYKGFPRVLGEVPSIFRKFSDFKPGNTRILEYNFVSKSVRIKSTPPQLIGKAIEYNKDGPRIVDVPVKRGPGRPRKYPRPEDGGGVAVGVVAKVASNGRSRGRPKKEIIKSSESPEGDVEIKREVKDSESSSLSDLETGDEG